MLPCTACAANRYWQGSLTNGEPNALRVRASCNIEASNNFISSFRSICLLLCGVPSLVNSRFRRRGLVLVVAASCLLSTSTWLFIEGPTCGSQGSNHEPGQLPIGFHYASGWVSGTRRRRRRFTEKAVAAQSCRLASRLRGQPTDPRCKRDLKPNKKLCTWVTYRRVAR
jgi:hypothetical protein